MNIPKGADESGMASPHLLVSTRWPDEEEGLPHVDAAEQAEQNPGLSVVIPARNEEAWIGSAVTSALRDADEVIVVDGGSRDGTADAARDVGAQVIASSPGRGRQMNAGARAARHDTLLFLHADSVLPESAGQDVRQALADPETVLTAFHLGITGTRSVYRWIEHAVALRTRWLHRPYGDQALAVKRETFMRLGGYADVPLLEDLDLVRRAAKRGTIALLPGIVQVSDRRYKSRGVPQSTLLNQAILIGNAIGIPHRVLAGWYGK